MWSKGEVKVGNIQAIFLREQQSVLLLLPGPREEFGWLLSGSAPNLGRPA
ncbi:hypothetical protein IMZ48_00405 [Candidatus Bathyarchaeota archaeon]|nr:hypothetical protein [Candidatus Bathyarchaeota archaeon]